MKTIRLQPGQNYPLTVRTPTRIVASSAWKSWIVPRYSYGLTDNRALVGVVAYAPVEIEGVVFSGLISKAVDAMANVPVTLRNCWVRQIGHWGLNGTAQWKIDRCLFEGIGLHRQWDHPCYFGPGSHIEVRRSIFRHSCGYAFSVERPDITGIVERNVIVGDGPLGCGVWCSSSDVRFVRNSIWARNPDRIVAPDAAKVLVSESDWNLIDNKGTYPFVHPGAGVYWPTRNDGLGAYDYDPRLTLDLAAKLWPDGWMDSSWGWGGAATSGDLNSGFMPHFPDDPIPNPQ